MDKQFVVAIIKEFRADTDKQECTRLKDFIALKIIKDSDFAELTVKRMNEVLGTAMDDVFGFAFTPDELKANVDLFRDCLKDRAKEILSGVDVSEKDIKERVNNNIFKCREAMKPSKNEPETCKKLQNSIANDVIEDIDDIQISYKEYKVLMAEVKEYIFGKGYFFTAKELRKYEETFKNYLKGRLKELLAAQAILYKEAEVKLTEEEKKAHENEVKAGQEALKEDKKTIRANKKALLEEINKELKKVITEEKKAELLKLKEEAEGLGVEFDDLPLKEAG